MRLDPTEHLNTNGFFASLQVFADTAVLVQAEGRQDCTHKFQSKWIIIHKTSKLLFGYNKC